MDFFFCSAVFLVSFSGICAAGYLFCGLLCFDRFTARAFLSNKDPRVTTAIASGNPETTSKNGGGSDTNNASTSTSVQTYSVTSSNVRDASTVGGNPDPPTGW